jgi:hypothetical protein
MAMAKTATYGLPTPVYQYGDADGTSAAAEFTSSMTAADTAINAAINVVSNVISAEIVNRVAAVNTVSNALSIVSQAVSIVSQAVSIVSAAGVIKAVNTDAQAAIQVSTMLTISGVSLPIVSGSNYFFKFLIPFTNDALTGIHIAVTGPTVTNFVAKVELPTGGTAQATTYTFATIPTIGGKVSNVSHALSAVTLIAIIEGYVNPSASTPSLHVTIGPTVNTASLVVQKGALGMAWKIS